MMLWALLLACGGPATPEPLPYLDPALPGPHAAGVTTVAAVDPRGHELLIEVWYPAVAGTGGPGTYPPLNLELEARRGGEPVPGPWPLVGFSHGSTAIRFQSAFLTEHLATHGFVVVAPDHANNTLLDTDDDLLGQVLLERPDDVRFAVDAVIELAGEEGLLRGLVEPGSWAVLGHSFGALTALLVGGGVPDLDAGAAYCASGGEGTGCRALTPALADQGRGRVFADPRVTTTIAMSPFAPYAFGTAGLQTVRGPLILGGDRDGVTAFDDEIVPVFEALGSPRRFLVFADAGHYPFSDICLLVPQFFDECDPNEPYADLATVQEGTKRAVTAHLLQHLVGDERYAAEFDAASSWEPAATLFTD